MGAGDVDVSIVEHGTAVTIKTAVEAAITATSAAARISVCQLDMGKLLIVAVEV